MYDTTVRIVHHLCAGGTQTAEHHIMIAPHVSVIRKMVHVNHALGELVFVSIAHSSLAPSNGCDLR